MKKTNFDYEHENLVPSELKVTASDSVEEEAQADLDGEAEEQDIEDLIPQRPVEQAEEWDDEVAGPKEEDEEFEISE